MADVALENDRNFLAVGGSYDFRRVTVTHASGSLSAEFGLQGWSTSGSIQNSTLRELTTGIALVSSSLSLTHVDLGGSETALSACDVGRVNVNSARVHDNLRGGLAVCRGTVLTVRQSSFERNAEFAVRNDDPATLASATDNWWNRAEGPGAEGADAVVGNVKTAPFLTAPPPGAGVVDGL